jgi:hypothetical protein
MTTKTGYIVIAIGCVLLVGGLLQTAVSVQSPQGVLMWGVIALTGAFVTAIGTVNAAATNSMTGI